MSARVCLGVIVGVKGLRGEVKIKSFTADPVDVAAYGPLTAADGRTLTLAVAHATDDVVVARVEGVADRTAAEALKGLELFVDRAVLPATDDGTYYHADLIGLAVEGVDGAPLGKVTAVHTFGGGDVMEVTAENAKGGKATSALLPFTADVIVSVDLAGGKVTVTPPPGTFEDGAFEDEEGSDQEKNDD